MSSSPWPVTASTLSALRSSVILGFICTLSPYDAHRPEQPEQGDRRAGRIRRDLPALVHLVHQASQLAVAAAQQVVEPRAEAARLVVSDPGADAAARTLVPLQE